MGLDISKWNIFFKFLNFPKMAKIQGYISHKQNSLGFFVIVKTQL